jgi:mRNA interferase MazF
LICPLTTCLVDAPLYRPQLEPDAQNGLQARSQIMTDKLGTAIRSRIGQIIGRLHPADLARLDTSLMVILALSGE